MIVTKNISKNFGHFQALKDISFEIQKGEIVGFLGQNGAGKTTLMRILTSFLPASCGDVWIDGRNIKQHSLFVREKVGYLPESPPLYTYMTVKEYLKYAAQLKNINAKNQNAQVEHMIDRCQLKDVRHKPIRILSKGYKQRVGLAQAMINEPEILILDEPTNGLDPVQIQEVRQLIKSFEHRRTVIVSTHILSEIENLAQRVLIIKRGEIIVDEHLDHLLNPAKSDSQDVPIKLTLEDVFIKSVTNE